MSRVLAIGTDIYRLGRFYNILQRNGPLAAFKTKRLCEKILNVEHEMPQFLSLQSKNDTKGCARLMAESWCAKEAVYKCLDSEEQRIFSMNQWWKYHDSNGRPKIGYENYSKDKNEQFLCTVSHDGDYMICTVLRQVYRTK